MFVRVSTMLMIFTFLFSPTTLAATYMLSFSGHSDLVTDQFSESGQLTYSGYLLLNYDLPDIQPGSDIGIYVGITTEINITINDQTYNTLAPATNIGSVGDNILNDGDLFGVGFEILNDVGESGSFVIQFRDTSGQWFAGDSLPTVLDLDSLDPFDQANQLSTGVFLPFQDGSDSTIFIELDSANLALVPLPAGIWLFVSAMTMLIWRGRA